MAKGLGICGGDGFFLWTATTTTMAIMIDESNKDDDDDDDDDTRQRGETSRKFHVERARERKSESERWSVSVRGVREGVRE